MKYLKLADQFGASFQPYIGGDKDSQFRTYIGGLTSIGVYALSLLYLIYQCYLWQTNQLIPTISTTKVNFDQIQYQIQNNQISLASSQFIGIDPFNPDAQILIPILLFNDEMLMLQQENGFLQFNQLNVSTNYLQALKLNFINCTDYWQDLYQIKCASDEIRNYYFSLLGQIQLNLTVQKYDVSKKTMISYKKNYQLSLDPYLTTLFKLTLQTANTEADIGFILPVTSFYNYIEDFQMITQSLSEGYIQNFFNLLLNYTNYNNSVQNPVKNSIPVSIIQFDVSNIQYQSIIQYPLLGTILAQVGSIYSLLLLSAKLINMLNSVWLEEYLVDQIIGYYYPEFKKIEIKENICGKNIIVRSKDKKIYYDPKEIGEIYKKSQKIAFAKLNYLNIIYEISRIQFILQSLQDRDILNQSHEIGIRLPLNIINQDSIKLKENIQEDELINESLTINQHLKIQPQQANSYSHSKSQAPSQIFETNEKIYENIQNQKELIKKYKLTDLDMKLFTLLDSKTTMQNQLIKSPNLFFETNTIK